MDTDHFVKVFDVLDSGYRDWYFPAFGLIFVALGTLIAVFPKIIKLTGIPFFNFKSRWGVFRRYGMLGFAIFWTAISFFGTFSQHLHHRTLAQENRCTVVQGPVEHFIPMPAAGHADESFSVSGVPFRYSDFGVTDAFNNTAAYGGPIKSDSYVRICYDPADRAILRLEIRDFAGERRDYAQAPSLFPQPTNAGESAPRNRRVEIPWYANWFLVAFVLDLVATKALFLPYLRTFFRIKTGPVRDHAIPGTIEPEKKMKLRNSVIYWSRETHTIWLRPRGFNLVQVPVVARLRTDASNRSIADFDIRFSSGFLVALALFFWSAYAIFSATMPPESPISPALFVGIFALLACVVGLIQLRVVRSRMEALVEDALSELNDTGRMARA